MVEPDTALAGVTVVELADAKAHYCGKVLADLGADVIKVEPPQGDATRRQGPFKGTAPDPEQSLSYLYFNTNKRGIALDLGTAEGQEEMRRMLRRADAVVESSPPGYLEGLGLGYPQVSRINPHLVMVSVTPFGQTGPYRHFKADDLICAATGGMMFVSRPAGMPPLALPGEQTYLIAALHAAYGLLLALREREASGQGQHVDISIQEVQALQQYNLVRYSVASELGWPSAISGAGPHGNFRCQDGYININVRGSRMWRDFLGWVGNPPEFQGPVWESRHYRGRHGDSLHQFFQEYALGYTKRELFEEGQGRAHLMIAPINDIRDFVESPQTQFRQYVTESTHPRVGRHAFVRGPQRFTETPWRLRHPAPLLGQHNPEVLGPQSPVPSAGNAAGRTQDPGPRTQDPLAGIRVVDFTWAVAGPYATRLLAEFGAEVIKIESSAKWQERGMRPGQDPNAALHQRATFADNNRNKLDITMNMGHPEARGIVQELVSKSDVVVENFSPRVMERWGIGYERLRAVKPDIIMCSLSGFGQDGPYREFTGAVSVVMAAAGFNYLWRPSLEVPPFSATNFHGDYVAGVQAATAIMAALHYRGRTGKGQYIDQSQAEVTAALLGPAYLDYLLNGHIAEPLGNHHPRYAPHNCYPCQGDDRWCAIAVTSEEEWPALCRAMGSPPWSQDPRFADMESRLAHQDELDPLIADWTRRHTPHQVMRILQGAGVPAGAVQNGEDLYFDPHLRTREFIVAVDHPDTGTVEYPGVSVRLSETPGRVRPYARMGEHNAYVFGELLEMPPQRVRELTDNGVLV